MEITRDVTYAKAVRRKVWLRLAIAGPSASGKTYSALSMMKGIQSVVGGKIALIDTEKRANELAEFFDFDLFDMDAPYSPADYLFVVQKTLEAGYKNIIVDSMTHEHSGTGGYMDISEKFLDDKCGDDEICRNKNFMTSLKRPAGQRKKLNMALSQMEANLIFCYQAADKVKPGAPGKGVEHIGWQPETTSKLPYSMTARFLLLPASDGRPNLWPETSLEKMLTKNPEQFRGWFNEETRLNEALGSAMATWATGEDQQPAEQAKSLPPAEQLKIEVRRVFGEGDEAKSRFSAWMIEAGNPKVSAGVALLKGLPSWQGVLVSGESKIDDPFLAQELRDTIKQRLRDMESDAERQAWAMAHLDPLQANSVDDVDDSKLQGLMETFPAPNVRQLALA